MWRVGLVAIACACGRIGFSHPDGRGDGVVDPEGPGTCGFDICEDFEAGFTPGLWTLAVNGVALDTTIAHSGTQSAHFTIPPTGVGVEADATIVETATFATGVKPFWVRAWIRLVGAPVNTNGLELFSTNQPTGGNSLGDYFFEHSDHVDIYTEFTDAAMEIPTMPQQATWTCVTWSVVPALNDTGTITLTGELGSTSLTSTTEGDPALTNIVLGLHFAGTNVNSAQPRIDMWLDDVTIHHAAINCGP